jgi:MoaA/NifB/PqqE/SkfB family radical SAM enzyme
VQEAKVLASRPPWLLSPRAIAWGPRLAQMVITRRCNIDCGYCNEYDKTSPPVPKQTIKRWVDKLADFSCLFVEFTGGETLLHPDLFELVTYASSYDFPERWIITNGYLLSGDIVDRLNDAGLTHLQISIDGVTPNATTVKVLKPLRKKLETLAARARFTVQVNAVLGAANAHEAMEVVSTARELGFRPRVSVVHDGDGQMCLDENGRRVLGEVSRAVGRRWRESGDYRTRLMRDGRADFKCRAGSRYLYIDEYGLVNWCSQQRGVFTKPFLEYGWDDLREQFHTAKGCAPTCTVGCVRTASRFDEWRGQSLTAEIPHRAPAVNQDALIPAGALRPRSGPSRKRSQAAWRKEQSDERA